MNTLHTPNPCAPDVTTAARSARHGMRRTVHGAFVAIAACVAMITMPGCAVTRDQSTVGAYIDDTAITTSVKARFIDNKDVDATSIGVETLNGTVMLSGFAKNDTEKVRAEEIARAVKGVKSVKNEIAVRS